MQNIYTHRYEHIRNLYIVTILLYSFSRKFAIKTIKNVIHHNCKINCFFRIFKAFIVFAFINFDTYCHRCAKQLLIITTIIHFLMIDCVLKLMFLFGNLYTIFCIEINHTDKQINFKLYTSLLVLLV